MQIPFRDRLAFPQGHAPGWSPTHVGNSGLGQGGSLKSFFGMSLIPGNNSFINIIQPSVLATVSGTAPTSIIIDSIGPCIGGFGTGGSFLSYPNIHSTNKTPSAWTMAAIITPVTLNLEGDAVLFGDDSLYTGLFLELEAGSGNNAGILCIYNNGSGFLAPSGITLVLNTPYFIAMSTNLSVTNYVVTDLRAGKIQSASISATLAAQGGTSQSWAVGGITSGLGGLGSGCNFAAVMEVLNNPLSLDELLIWAQDPWSYWYPSVNDDVLAYDLNGLGIPYIPPRRFPQQEIFSWTPPDPQPITALNLLPGYGFGTYLAIPHHVPIATTWIPPDPQPPLVALLMVPPAGIGVPEPIRGAPYAPTEVQLGWIPAPPMPIVGQLTAGSIGGLPTPVAQTAIVHSDILINWIPPPPDPIFSTRGGQLEPTKLTPLGVEPVAVKQKSTPSEVLIGWIPPDPQPPLVANNLKFIFGPEPFAITQKTSDISILNMIDAWILADPQPITAKPVLELPPFQAPIGTKVPLEVQNDWLPADPQPILANNILPPTGLMAFAGTNTLAQRMTLNWIPADPMPIVASNIQEPFRIVPLFGTKIPTEVQFSWIAADPASIEVINQIPPSAAPPATIRQTVEVADVMSNWWVALPQPLINPSILTPLSGFASYNPIGTSFIYEQDLLPTPSVLPNYQPPPSGPPSFFPPLPQPDDARISGDVFVYIWEEWFPSSTIVINQFPIDSIPNPNPIKVDEQISEWVDLYQYPPPKSPLRTPSGIPTPVPPGRGLTNFLSISYSWNYIPPPQPVVASNLIPPAGQTVPPGRGLLNLTTLIQDWTWTPPPQPIVAYNLAPPSGRTVQYGLTLTNLTNVLFKWIPPDPQPISSFLKTPPLGMTQPQGPPVTLNQIMASWIPPDPSPYFGQSEPMEPSTLTPPSQPQPVGTRVVSNLHILFNWIPPDPQPIIAINKAPPAGLTVPAGKALVNYNTIVHVDWIPPPPQPTLNPFFTASGLPVLPGTQIPEAVLIEWFPPDDPMRFLGNVAPLQPKAVVPPSAPYFPIGTQNPPGLSNWIPPDPAPITATEIDQVPPTGLIQQLLGSITPQNISVTMTGWIPPDPSPWFGNEQPAQQFLQTPASGNNPFLPGAQAPLAALIVNYIDQWIPVRVPPTVNFQVAGTRSGVGLIPSIGAPAAYTPTSLFVNFMPTDDPWKFIGGKQPLEGIKRTPQAGFAPRGSLGVSAEIQTGWIPLPPQPIVGQLTAGSTGGLPTPVPLGAIVPTSVLVSWIPPPWDDIFGQGASEPLEPVSLTPPAGLVAYASYKYPIELLWNWTPPAPQPITGQLFPLQGSFAPQGPIVPQTLYSIQTDWIPPPPQSPVAINLPPPAGKTVPQGRSTINLYSITLDWTWYPDPQPIVAFNTLPPSMGYLFPSGSVYRAQTEISLNWLPPAPQPITGAIIYQSGITVPPGRAPINLQSIIQDWTWYPDPAPIVAYNNIPPSGKSTPTGRGYVNLTSIMFNWIIPDPQPIVAVNAIPPAGLTVGFGRQPANIPLLTQTWIPPDPQPIVAYNTTPPTQDARPIITGPFKRENWIVIQDDWIPPAPQPITAINLMPPSGKASPVPVGARLGTDILAHYYNPAILPELLYQFGHLFSLLPTPIRGAFMSMTIVSFPSSKTFVDSQTNTYIGF